MPAATSARALPALAADIACLVLFAAVGRASHGEVVDAAGMLTTLWPFLVGLAVAWVAGRLWRRPVRVVPAGLLAWVATVAVGTLLRAMSGQGVQVAFVVVAAVVTAALLLGWRSIAGVIARRRFRRAAAGSPSS